MYTMKEACKLTGLPYETLKFYCNQGLVPNVKRSESNYRLFDERDIKWINSLCCLKSCGMSIGETKEYLALCLQGQASIPERKAILERHREDLEQRMREIQSSIDYIDRKQNFYDEVLAGKTKYFSDLITEEA